MMDMLFGALLISVGFAMGAGFTSSAYDARIRRERIARRDGRNDFKHGMFHGQAHGANCLNAFEAGQRSVLDDGTDYEEISDAGTVH